MASGSVKRYSVNGAADSSDLHISKMKSFVFGEVMKNDGFMFFI
jgi:hypothetical protein